MIERFSEHVYANVYCRANSTNAAKFLREFSGNVLYKVRSIQVDEGHEFMKDFEETCQELAIPLFVLPPAKPTYNGKVGRGNKIFCEEFYDDLLEDTITGTQRKLSKFVRKYNSYRPHFSLHGLTPLKYLGMVQGTISVSRPFELAQQEGFLGRIADFLQRFVKRRNVWTLSSK